MKTSLSSLSGRMQDTMSPAPTMVSSAYDPSQLQQPQQPRVTNSSGLPYPSTSSSSSLTNLSPGIIITILILSLTIILTTSLCLLFRHFHRLPNFLSRHGRPSSNSSDSSSRQLSHRPPTPATVNQSLIDSLPLFSFSSITRRNNASAAATTSNSSSAAVDADCAVCLSRFVSHDTLRLLPLCCHAFHSQCIDTWLSSGRDTCPLCRSNVYSSPTIPAESILHPPVSSISPNGSFRLEIGSVSRRRNDSVSEGRRSYSIGSFDYVVEADSEVAVADRRSVYDKDYGVNNNTEITELNSDGSNLISGATTGVGGSRSWLGEYMDRLSATMSSRTASFRSSGRFFTGNSWRSEVAGVGEWDIEASRVGEEITELFRWASGV